MLPDLAVCDGRVKGPSDVAPTGLPYMSGEWVSAAVLDFETKSALKVFKAPLAWDFLVRVASVIQHTSFWPTQLVFS